MRQERRGERNKKKMIGRTCPHILDWVPPIILLTEEKKEMDKRDGG